MSSKDIAELTGKMHKDVLYDIRRMLEALGIAEADFSATAWGPGPNGSTRPYPAFNLPKDLTITLVTGYNVVMRHRIVTRWQELEAQVAAPALPNFNNPATGHALTFRGDGWFNMTTAAKAFGKHLHNFWASPATNEYMLALIDSLSMNSMEKPPKVTDIRRGSGLYPTTGTWAHPKLAVFFARWLDVRFAVWCDSVIDELLRGHHPDPFQGPTELPINPAYS